MPTDEERLRRYATECSEEAFRELVDTHVDLVHSVAWRQTGDPHAAKDVAQSVFADLAGKAARLPRGTVLPGWL